MITTMMWVIIVIIILVLLMILVLKKTKKYHITRHWCQNIRDNMVEKGKNSGKALPPPHFRAMPERKRFFIRGVPLIPLYFYTPWDSRSSTKSWLLSLTAKWSAELPGKKVHKHVAPYLGSNTCIFIYCVLFWAAMQDIDKVLSCS